MKTVLVLEKLTFENCDYFVNSLKTRIALGASAKSLYFGFLI